MSPKVEQGSFQRSRRWGEPAGFVDPRAAYVQESQRPDLLAHLFPASSGEITHTRPSTIAISSSVNLYSLYTIWSINQSVAAIRATRSRYAGACAR